MDNRETVNPERLWRFDALDQCLVEHFIIGSSMPFKEDDNLSFTEFTKRIRKGEVVDRDILRPLRLLEQPEQRREVEMRRQTRSSLEPFEGIITVIDPIYQIEMSHSLAFELPPLLPSGEVRPSWRLSLIRDGRKINDIDELIQLTLTERGKEFFKIDFFEVENEVRLVFTK